MEKDSRIKALEQFDLSEYPGVSLYDFTGGAGIYVIPQPNPNSDGWCEVASMAYFWMVKEHGKSYSLQS